MSDDRESLQIYYKANNSTLFTYDSTSPISMIVDRAILNQNLKKN